MTINSEIYDRQLDHDVMVRFYEEKLNRDIDRIYRLHAAELRRIYLGRGDVRAKLRRIEREVLLAHRRLFRMMSSEMREFVIQEMEFNRDSLQKAMGRIYRVRTPSRTELLNLVTQRPIRDNRVMAAHFSDIAAGEQTRIERVIRSGIRDGLTTQAIADAISSPTGRSTGSEIKISRLQARALVRTAVTELASVASDRVYMENSDVVDSYQYVATLDSRTTLICSALDTRVFPVDKPSAPRPPQHWNCRSTTVPVVKAFEDLEGLPTVTPSRLEGRRRAEFSGNVARQESYNTWLRRQPYETQLRHFGGDEERTQIFRSGNVPLRKFVNAAGAVASIETLRKLNAAANS